MSDIEYEYAVFERIDGRVAIVGRPYPTEYAANSFIKYLEDKNPKRLFYLRRRAVGGWETIQQD